MRKFLLFTLFITTTVFIGCRKDEFDTQSKYTFQYSSEFLRNWFKLECRIVKETPGFFPPQAARAFGYAGITAYEAVVGGISNGRSLAGQLTDLKPNMLPSRDNAPYDWSIAANAAMADILRKMFEKKLSADNAAKITAMEEDNLSKMRTGVGADIVQRSILYGQAVANAIFEYAKTDGGHEEYLNPFELPFTPPTGPGKWVSTNPNFPTPLSPTWKRCRYMLASDTLFSKPLPPTTFSTETNSAFYQQALAVYNQVRSNTAEQIEITKFWADDPFATCTPTGHSFNILTQVLEETRASLEKAAVAYAQMGIAENDAFIACWKVKYEYFNIRPVSYIKQNIDPSFATVIGTPPFPAYTSGHATEAGAASRVLTRLFTNGSGDYPFTDRTQIQFGFSVRNFANFNDMAEECANSRFFGGIHYREDNTRGLQMGRGIGDNVATSIEWPRNIK